MNKKTIRDVDLTGKRVLVRVDFNVPLEDGKVDDNTRIEAALPTLRYILDQNPKAVILTSHLGRPKGDNNAEFSLKPVAERLSELLGQPVEFSPESTGTAASAAINELPESGIILLENTRFNSGETKNDETYASELAKHGDIFVNDAFGTAHRSHSSNVGVSQHLEAVAGLLLEKEIEYLSNAIENPERPFVAILGGAKVSDKIEVIEALLNKVDYLLIGGGMANTFFAAQGIEIGDSLVEEDAIDTAKHLLEKGGDKLVLPTDVIVANDFDNDADHKSINVTDGVESGWRILDIGQETINRFGEILDDAQTIVWNGPMGVFEMENFAKGTFAVADQLAKQTESGSTTIIGGGDSASAVEKSGLADKMTHISTGGGASLEMLEGKELPGLAALADK